MSDNKSAISTRTRNSRTSSGTLHNEEKEKSSANPPRGAKKINLKKQEKNESNRDGKLTEDESTENSEDESENNKDQQQEIFSSGQQRRLSASGQQQETSSLRQQRRPSTSGQKQESSIPDQQQKSFPSGTSFTKFFIIGVVATLVVAFFTTKYGVSDDISDSSSYDKKWRSKVDPHDSLSNDQQSIIRASLKPILDKPSTRDEGVSTLLILSSNEESAAKLARCLLGLVNKKKNKDQISEEIDLQSHRGGKSKLDSNLRTLLNTTNGIRAVLLRHVDDIPLKDTLEQLRLLFAYCDGENPVIPHRLIIMTATSSSKNENELRENFKTRLPNEHDFIDALMSRISGHTLYVEKDQKSIC